ncbi:hypothetical protein [Rhodococcus marinonascens]|uniref:hypothetical protein n=1 Tax=Rhodococcus marinonascens TaxID=38311 RepID=UPI000934E762|nr:hypothetical protein [Rhodococcus marinonascens]
MIAGHRTLLNDFPRGLQCLASIDFDSSILEVVVGYKQVGVETAGQAWPVRPVPGMDEDMRRKRSQSR